MKCVIVGASGLVGQELLKKLIDDSRITEVTVITRRILNLTHPKIKVKIISFDEMKNFDLELEIKNFDVAFCCLGTTLKKAGSKGAFFKVDHDYILDFAQKCIEAKIENFILVSAMGADQHSKIFYSQVKGKTEEDLKKLNFKNLVINRPGLLIGEREENRPLEKLAQKVGLFLSPIMLGPFKKYRPTPAWKVASEMLESAFKVILVTE
jgi:uncharacterized protein YbjT (DUF2867 family)